MAEVLDRETRLALVARRVTRLRNQRDARAPYVSRVVVEAINEELAFAETVLALAQRGEI